MKKLYITILPIFIAICSASVFLAFAQNNMSCGDWGACVAGSQTKICQALDGPEAGMTFTQTQSCITPTCYADTWSCDGWNKCVLGNYSTTRNCTKTFDCEFADTPSPNTTQSCSWFCIDWSACSLSGTQERICIDYEGNGTTDSRSCTPVNTNPTCTADTWECGNWSTCVGDIQTRTCTKVIDCTTVNTSSPSTIQSCIK